MCKRPGVSGQGGGWGSQANGRGGYVTDQGSQGKEAGGSQANGGGGYVRDQGSQANGRRGYTRYQGSHNRGGGAI